MPADDLVLNVRQIAGYTAVGSALGSDMLLLQRGGLGGPYQSISAEDLIGTALLGGGPLQIGVAAPGDATSQVFTSGLATPLGGWWLWNAYVATAGNTRLATGPAALIQMDPTNGWKFWWAPTGAAGTLLDGGEVNHFTISPTGYLTVGDQVLLARDPAAPLEAATAQYVDASVAASVTFFNGRTGAVRLWIDDIIIAGGAPIHSPIFTGCPQADTPPSTSNSNRLATTAFVNYAITTILAADVLVSSFNGRTGAVVLTVADVTALALPYAPLDSPNFTGYATSLTPPPGTSDGQIATTAFVMNAVSESTTGVASFNGRTGIVTLTGTDLTAAGGALLASPVFTGAPTAPTPPPADNSTRVATTAYVMGSVGTGFAPINSPAFTGVPTAPTAALATNTTQLATCAFVMNEINAVNAGVISFNGRTGAITLIANDISAAGGATLLSPAFTGVPTAPLAAPGTNTSQIATTAFVTGAISAIPAGPVASTTLPLMNGTAAAGSSLAWSRGDHVHPTDTSRAAASLLANYLPLAGGTVSGNTSFTAPVSFAGATFGGAVGMNTTLNVNGVITTLAGGNFGGALQAAVAVYAKAGPSTGAAHYCMNNAGTVMGTFLWNNTDGTVQMVNNATPGGSAFVANNGGFQVSGAPYCPGGGPWNAISDARIKTVEGDYEAGLNEVLQLDPVVYRYKGNAALSKGGQPAPAANGKSYVGLVAQAVEAIFPEMVTKGAGWVEGVEVTDLRSLDTGPLIFALVNAIKTLAARLAALETA